MMPDYIPQTDGAALAWMRSFADVIAADPAAYQLTGSDSDAITQAVDTYQDAYYQAQNKTTRTQATVSLKDEMRNAAEQICRQYAIGIKYNAGISTQAKIDVGVRPVNPSREPIYCPQTSPVVNVVAATPGAHTVRFADSMTPDTRAKPFGATGLQLYAYIGEEITDNEDLAQFIGLYTRNPIAVAFTPEDDGKMCTYFARWCGKRGDTGPFSLPVSMRIAA